MSKDKPYCQYCEDYHDPKECSVAWVRRIRDRDDKYD